MQKMISSRLGYTIILLFLLFAAVDFVFIYFIHKDAIQKEDILYQVAYDATYERNHNAIIKDLMEGQLSENKVELAREKLKVIGYTQEYQSYYLKQAKVDSITISFFMLLFYTIVSVLISGMYIKQKQDEGKRLSQIENILSSFQSYVYNIDYNYNLEGEMPSIYARLNSLGEKIKFNERQMLYEKEKTKTMVTDISHQLKTPLAALKAFFELMTEEDLTEEERKEFLQRCRNQLDHLQQLTASLIQISRMEKGMIDIKKERASILDTIAEAVSTMYAKAQEKQIGIELLNTEEEESTCIPHDRKWTKEVFVNILDNAIKYSNDNTRVEIRIMRRSSYLRIEIEDQGSGIPKKEYHMIFKRFFRGSNAEKMAEEGSGVGLYLAREIIERQQGSLTVASHIIEKKAGSIFVIQLPYRDNN